MSELSEFPPLRPGDIHPSHIMRDVYGMNAANRPLIIVEPSEVPDHLKPLIPYVERWAIGCDVTRHDYFDQQSEEDINDFWRALEPHLGAINKWLNEQPREAYSWSDAATQFLCLLKARSEAFPLDDDRQ